jgi:predicted RNase H-like HicB family nuclease
MAITIRSTYFALVHKDEGSDFGVTFPDLPGCFSASDDENSIITNAMEAIELYAEDSDAMPAPRGISAVSSDSDVAAELASDAYLIAIPYIRNTQRTTRVNITLPKGLLDAIDEEAIRRKMTRSVFMAQAAEREVLG